MMASSGYESTTGLSMSSSAPPWQGRSIASSKLRMLEFSSFLEQPQDPETVSPSQIYYWCSCWSTWLTLTDIFVLQVNKHLFVHIGQSNPTYSDPYLEAVDIRQIYDKFPEKKGGLKELFEKGPANAFFLVKFWVRTSQIRPKPWMKLSVWTIRQRASHCCVMLVRYIWKWRSAFYFFWFLTNLDLEVP